MSALRYLRCTSTRDAHGAMAVGEVYAFHFDTKRQTWDCPVSKQTTYCFNEEEIRAHFEPATRAEFEASIVRVMQELEAVEAQHQQIVKELQGTSDLALHSGETEVPESEPEGQSDLETGSTDTRLSRPVRKHPAALLRNKAHSLTRKIGTFAESVKTKRDLIESKMKQQLAAFQAKVDEMNEQVAKLVEVVHMVNLYLGRDEAITCLREGAPAPVGTPISFRQNVLYMDEECALQESHGIDFTEIEKFDKWLLAKPEHLEQVIPNPKGVVVLQVRRSPKEYDYEKGDLAGAIECIQKNQENMKSYWLIRNGARLHRLWTDVAVGPRLVPREDELDHFFESREYNFTTGEYDEETIRPGSAKFYGAMKKCNAHRRHYMRLLLVLQGLLDRTQLFQPYTHGIRPNLIDDTTWGDQIVFVRDTEKVIEDGEPSFREWQRETNKHLHAGQRVVGVFPTYFNEREGERSRLTPRNAAGPSTDGVYTLEESVDGFKFLYDRGERRWKRDYWNGGREVAIKKRGSYRIDPDDRFFICVDNVDVAKAKYYLADRRHRKDYEGMIPILRAAIKLREKEAAEEQPFRELLLRKLAEAYPENPCTPERLEEIISWWKFKVKAHRPLLADDKKAYTMIMAEYRRQSSISPAETERQIKVMQVEGLPRMTDSIACWYCGDGKFVVLLAVEVSPVFVVEQVWRVVGDVPVKVSESEWVLPRKADYLRWRVVLSSPAWEKRPEVPRPQDYLAGPHHAALIEWVRANRSTLRSDQTEELLAIYLIHSDKHTVARAVTVDEVSDRSRGWVSREPRKTGPLKLLDRWDSPDYSERGVTWKMKKGQLVFGYEYLGGTRTFDHGVNGIRFGWKDSEAELLWIDQAKFDALAEKRKLGRAHETVRRAAEEWIDTARRSAKDYLRAQWEAAERTKFLNDGGDEEFFADHLKTLMKPKIETDGLTDALESAVNTLGAVAPLTGCTLAGALRQAKIKLKRPGAGLRALVQSDWVLPQVEKEEPEPEDPEADDDGDDG